jgi:putative heme-binding domain-containing protein
MLQNLTKSLAICVLVCSAVSPAAAADDEFQSLFNGQDLEGWQGDPNVWSVEDGAIVGRNTAEAPIKNNTFLIWQGEDLGDFELELEYKLEGGNSGVQYRSQVVDPEKWIVGGYQADMEAGRNFTGILYDERGRGILAGRGETVVLRSEGKREVARFAEAAELQKEIRANDWNKYRITARGHVFEHTINDKVMSKTVDEDMENREATGVLALQVHAGPPMTVRYRNLRLKRLGEPARDADRPAPAGAPSVTPSSQIKVPPGFHVELVYAVPRRREGSWIAMAADPEGRLYVSSENGKLYRVSPQPFKSKALPRIDPVNVDLGPAQGLLWAQERLYVVVNSNDSEHRRSGLYRLQDTDGDDQLDQVQLLRTLAGSGEHGPHAVVLGPGGNDLYIVGGNHTELPEIDRSLVPRVWDEDQLLPPFYDPGGHAVDIRAPGGWICRTDFDGQEWELVSVGYRNTYDVAFNQHGDLFAFDADMEWDLGAPWYRPTRVCHATSGSEFGWRTGSGKWPAYYPDSLPGILDVGPGSPTGVTFGYGSNFPEPYQSALFICDWSFGALHVVFLQPNGASYDCAQESFVTGAPLPLTDVIIHPRDGAMYFTIGGRGTQSGLYRVTYTGGASDQPSVATRHELPEEAMLRRELQQWHGRVDSAAVEAAWPHLSHPDRFIRFAARTAIEWQPVTQWQQRVFIEPHPVARIEALVALARCADPESGSLAGAMVDSLGEISWHLLSKDERLALLRAYQLVLVRQADDDPSLRASIIRQLDSHFPASNVEINRELVLLLAYLKAPGVMERALAQQAKANTQEDQIHYALALRNNVATAPHEEQQQYFAWFRQAAKFHGGFSLRRYVTNVRDAAVAQLDEAQRDALAEVLAPAKEEPSPSAELANRPMIHAYTTEQVLTLAANGFDDCDRAEGRRLFAAAQCFQCHRVDGEGGLTGPDLTSLGNRFGTRDIVEAIVEPNKFVADRFRQTQFILEDGRVVTGRVANMFGKNLLVVTDMLAPGNYTRVDRDLVESSESVEASQMPEGLINTLTEEEVRNLLAFLSAPQN